MNLKEILASRPKIKEIKPPKKEEDEDFIEYKSQSIEAPDSSLFLALHTPYIRNPYKFDWFVYREYYKFLLGETYYVINQFIPLDIEKILSLYLKHNPPKNLREYSFLASFLNHMHLITPRDYQKKIEDIIQENSPCIFPDFSVK